MEDVPGVELVPDQEVVEGLAPQGADDLFAVGVHPRSPRRGPHNLDVVDREDRVEGLGVLRVPVSEQETQRVRPTNAGRRRPSFSRRSVPARRTLRFRLVGPVSTLAVGDRTGQPTVAVRCPGHVEDNDHSADRCIDDPAAHAARDVGHRDLVDRLPPRSGRRRARRMDQTTMPTALSARPAALLGPVTSYRQTPTSTRHRAQPRRPHTPAHPSVRRRHQRVQIHSLTSDEFSSPTGSAGPRRGGTRCARRKGPAGQGHREGRQRRYCHRRVGRSSTEE